MGVVQDFDGGAVEYRDTLAREVGRRDEEGDDKERMLLETPRQLSSWSDVAIDGCANVRI